MNLKDPISSYMTTDLMVVESDDKVLVVKNIMEDHNLHHVPVVRFNKLVGLISKSDLLYFLKGMSPDSYEGILNEVRVKNYIAEEIMTENLECLSPDDTIQKALELFQKNKFHAIPIVDDEDSLLGILTTFDIVNILLQKNVKV